MAESFSFQRPAAFQENFRLLDQRLDVGAAMRKPYRRRKVNLFYSLESLVEDRNELVLTGKLRLGFFDASLKLTLSDMEVAVNRVYEYLGSHYGFTPSHDY